MLLDIDVCYFLFGRWPRDIYDGEAGECGFFHS
jgi:hypothetical protein